MVKMSAANKDRMQTFINITKTTFHWGFIPLVIYLGEISILFII